MLQLQGIHKTFSGPEGRLEVVRDVSLSVEKGDIYGIIGTSGAGKSTLLRTINLLERPDRGEVWLDGEELTRLGRRQLRLRRLEIGMIFQHFNLIGNRTVHDNVSFPLEIGGVPKAARKARIEEALGIVGLTGKAHMYPAKLSGGQKQRVAIARALVTRPKLLLCDEPTSALDPDTTAQILQFLQEINRTLQITIVIVTHEMEVVSSLCGKVSVMEQGRIVESLRLADRTLSPKSRLARLLLKRGAEYVDGEKEGAYGRVQAYD